MLCGSTCNVKTLTASIASYAVLSKYLQLQAWLREQSQMLNQVSHTDRVVAIVS